MDSGNDSGHRNEDIHYENGINNQKAVIFKYFKVGAKNFMFEK